MSEIEDDDDMMMINSFNNLYQSFYNLYKFNILTTMSKVKAVNQKQAAAEEAKKKQLQEDEVRRKEEEERRMA